MGLDGLQLLFSASELFPAFICFHMDVQWTDKRGDIFQKLSLGSRNSVYEFLQEFLKDTQYKPRISRRNFANLL